MNSQTCAEQAAGLIQFPQPTRPINSYNMSTSISSEPLPSSMPQPAKPVSIVNMASTSGVHVYVAPPTEEEDRETLDGLLGFISELREKVPAKIADQFQNIKDGTKGPVSVQKGTSRGRQGSVEEFSHKLERFKIRTLDLGVVKEEEKR